MYILQLHIFIIYLYVIISGNTKILCHVDSAFASVNMSHCNINFNILQLSQVCTLFSILKQLTYIF